MDLRGAFFEMILVGHLRQVLVALMLISVAVHFCLMKQKQPATDGQHRNDS